jgi:hypothetical protein
VDDDKLSDGDVAAIAPDEDRIPMPRPPVETTVTAVRRASSFGHGIHRLRASIQFGDIRSRRPTPSLLPTLRARQQGEILTAVSAPTVEHSLTALAERLRLPYPSSATPTATTSRRNSLGKGLGTETSFQ